DRGREGAAHAAPARAQRPRPAGHAGPARLLGTPLSRRAPRADAQVSASRLAGGRRERRASLNESPDVAEARAPAWLRRAAIRADAPRSLRNGGRVAGTIRRVPSRRSPAGRRSGGAPAPRG